MMINVEQYGLNTVINKKEFTTNVLIKECPMVGRSLVARKTLHPGDIVLVEEPLISYQLNPTCRSSKSPYFSKNIWKTLISFVHEEEHRDSVESIPKNYSSPTVDEYDSEYDDESDDEEGIMAKDESDFCPGVPAAIYAFLDICPPPSYEVRGRKSFQLNDFDFFYYPDSAEESQWLGHKTIQLIEAVCLKVVKNISLFSHISPSQLSNFVLKIYSNAHTVALPSTRTTPTHTAKKNRQLMYASKFKDRTTWGNDNDTKSNTPTIALMLWGSKFAHSCSPNMFLRYEPSNRTMIFTVTRTLKENEILTFSYLPEDDMTLGGLVCGGIRERRNKLEKYKFFKCQCDRCMDWDWSRGTICGDCKEYSNYYHHGIWTCLSCEHTTTDEDTIGFIGEYERSVGQMVMGFSARINGQRPLNESTMRMLEPYLSGLLKPSSEKQVDPVPVNHWIYGIIQSLLAIYHLSLFPKSFGKGLASQLGLTVQGLEEAALYLEFLDRSIRTHPKTSSLSTGNPVAAFFASWRVLSIVIDLVMESTENKYINKTYEKDDNSDSECDIIEKDSDTKVTKNEPVLVGLQSDWIAPLQRITALMNHEWLSLIKKIFASHHSIVIDDMLKQIEAFIDRINKTS